MTTASPDITPDVSRIGEFDHLVVKAVEAPGVDACVATNLPTQSGLYTLAPSGRYAHGAATGMRP
jgi:hypothetical protein